MNANSKQGRTLSLKSDYLALLGLSAFTIAQPVLDTLGHGSTFFVAHGAATFDILTFAILIYLLPAALLIALVACLQLLSTTVARLCISVVIGLLAGLWIMKFALTLPAAVSIAIALGFGFVMGYCYSIFPRFREIVQIIGLLSPVVVVYFLAFSPAKSLVFPDSDLEGGRLAGRETPIVMIVFDELSLAAITTPDGMIDAGRLPNFARLEHISTWYHDTTTVSTHTEKAVPAILSGIRTDENSQPFYTEFPRNLFTLLGTGHAINATETYTRLCPASICSENGAAARDGFDRRSMYRDVWIVWLYSILPAELAGRHLPSISNRWSGFSGEGDNAAGESAPNRLVALLGDMARSESRRFSEFVSVLHDNTGPTVTYLHLALPHTPWIYLPDGTAYNGQSTLGKSLAAVNGWMENQYLVDQAVLRYSLQVEYVDLLLGQALDALEQSGRLNHVMLIVVSDHGIAFAPGEEQRIPVATTLADMSRVPLFIKYPGQVSGERDNRKVETIDIFPTIADVLGLPLNGEIDGRSLIADNWQPVRRHVLEAGDKFPDMEQMINMKAASERIYRVIKPGKSALDAIGLGSGRPFIGKPPPAQAGVDPRFILQLDNSKWYTEVDPDSGFLPARMTGVLSGARLGTEVMVALNGTVAGSGMTHDESGRVSIMLDPRHFRSGSNELQAYIIGASGIMEVAVTLDFEGWTIHRNDEGAVSIIDENGASYHQDETLKGKVTFSLGPHGVTILRGSACDETLQLGPTALLLVENTSVITSRFTMATRAFLSRTNIKCEFSTEVNADLLQRADALSVLALFEGGRVLEMPVLLPGKFLDN